MTRDDDERQRIKKEQKRIYDIAYRKSNADWLKMRKHEYFKQTYNPILAQAIRKRRAPQHAEYCRRPEYKTWKREYDANRRANEYGSFSDCYRLLLTLEKEILSHMTRYEIAMANGVINKRLKRKREYESFVSGRP